MLRHLPVHLRGSSRAIVCRASRPCRTANSSSRNCSGSPTWPAVTSCSSRHTSSVSVIEVVAQPPDQHRDQRGGQLAGPGRAQPPAVEPAGDACASRRRPRRADGGVHRAVHGEQPVRPDELVELDVVHVAAAHPVPARAARGTSGRGRREPWAPGCDGAVVHRLARAGARRWRRNAAVSASQYRTSIQTRPGPSSSASISSGRCRETPSGVMSRTSTRSTVPVPGRALNTRPLYIPCEEYAR